MLSVMQRVIFLNSFDIGDRWKIGRYELLWFWSLFGLEIGTILASFQNSILGNDVAI